MSEKSKLTMGTFRSLLPRQPWFVLYFLRIFRGDGRTLRIYFCRGEDFIPNQSIVSPTYGHMLEFPIHVFPFDAGIPYQNFLWFSSSGFNSTGFRSKRFLRLSAVERFMPVPFWLRPTHPARFPAERTPFGGLSVTVSRKHS